MHEIPAAKPPTVPNPAPERLQIQDTSAAAPHIVGEAPRRHNRLSWISGDTAKADEDEQVIRMKRRSSPSLRPARSRKKNLNVARTKIGLLWNFHRLLAHGKVEHIQALRLAVDDVENSGRSPEVTRLKGRRADGEKMHGGAGTSAFRAGRTI